MTPEQFTTLIKVLSAHRPYTLTGADDYPILATTLGGLVLGVVYIWQDLKHTIMAHKQEWKEELESEISERKEQDSFIWKALREHKLDCEKEREKK